MSLLQPITLTAFWDGAPPSDALRQAIATVVVKEEGRSYRIDHADVILYQYRYCHRENLAGAPLVANLQTDDALAVYLSGRAQSGESWDVFKKKCAPGIEVDHATHEAKAETKGLAPTPLSPSKIVKDIETSHAQAAARAREQREHDDAQKMIAATSETILTQRAALVESVRSAAAAPPADGIGGEAAFGQGAITNAGPEVLNSQRRQLVAEHRAFATFTDDVAEELRLQLKGNEIWFTEACNLYYNLWKKYTQIPNAQTLLPVDAVGVRFISRWPDQRAFPTQSSCTWGQHITLSLDLAAGQKELDEAPPFPPELASAIQNQLNMVIADEQVAFIHAEYVIARRRYRQVFPAIESLTAKDAAGVWALTNYDFTNNETWAEHCARQDRYIENLEQASNPFMPTWNSKTEDRPNPWASATGLTPENRQECAAFDKVFKSVMPMSASKSWMELVGVAPTDPATMEYLADVIVRSSPIIAKIMGIAGDDSTSEFRTSSALVTLAGLGLTILRHVARKIADEDGSDAIWQHFAQCSDAQLREEIIRACAMSCYPISLLRAPYVELQKVCTQHPESSPPLAPHWLPSSLVMHIYKHVRLRKNYKGKPTLWIAYDGQYSHVAFTPEGLDQRLTDPVNAKLKASIYSILKIHKPSGRQRSMLDAMIDSTFSRLHPSSFPELKNLRSIARLVVPKAVTISADPVHRTVAPWINPGISVSGLYHIRKNDGAINPTTVNGEKATMFDWPQATMTASEARTFQSILPKTVKPTLPSELLRKCIHNINGLGHMDGYDAIINGTLCGNVIRDELAGSPAGNAMISEYPLLAVMPMGSTKMTTTNQGKTCLARILGNVLVQGLPVTQAGRSASPPAQRAMVSPIEKFGTAIYDEFVLPVNDEHCLAQAGLQMLLTGGTITPGRANENSEGTSLKYPLIVTSKCAFWPPDIISRGFPSFLNTLTPDLYCSGPELNKIHSGALALEIKLSMMLWIEETGFVAKARKAEIVGGIHRFDGHISLALLVCADGKRDEIREYLAAASKQCAEQAAAAADSGLLDGMGIGPQFDPTWYFREAKEETLVMIQNMTREDPMNIGTFMRELIRDQNLRLFDSVVGAYPRTPERRAQGAFSEALQEGKMVRSDGWSAKQGSIKYPMKGARRSVIVTKALSSDVAARV